VFSEYFSEWVTARIGRVLEWHSRGLRFDPDRIHQKTKSLILSGFLFFGAGSNLSAAVDEESAAEN
jgi:hypothetical protein